MERSTLCSIKREQKEGDRSCNIARLQFQKLRKFYHWGMCFHPGCSIPVSKSAACKVEFKPACYLLYHYHWVAASRWYPFTSWFSPPDRIPSLLAPISLFPCKQPALPCACHLPPMSWVRHLPCPAACWVGTSVSAVSLLSNYKSLFSLGKSNLQYCLGWTFIVH